MKRSDFNYTLPNELIARYPTAQRQASRLLVLDGDSGDMSHRQFVDILGLIKPGDLLVLNDTRVIPARLYGKKSTGGRVEILIERIIDKCHVLAHIKASKSPKAGAIINLHHDENNSGADSEIAIEVQGRQGQLFKLAFPKHKPVLEVVDLLGHMPLPPYIDRPDEISDQERYQTVYGFNKGAVAAPTAGLHFDEPTLEQIRGMGVDIGFVTLHVGAGTFQPVRVDDIKDHQMHSEYIEVSEVLCEQLRRTRQNGGRVIAVGTTSVRCLETASTNGVINPYKGDTDIFIYPGYKFQQVDALLTNFHLPESTLLMLVSAFAGSANIVKAYQQAIAEKYRFFSYGDAMFLYPQTVR